MRRRATLQFNPAELNILWMNRLPIKQEEPHARFPIEFKKKKSGNDAASPEGVVSKAFPT
jgi:hypothetical protein